MARKIGKGIQAMPNLGAIIQMWTTLLHLGSLQRSMIIIK